MLRDNRSWHDLLSLGWRSAGREPPVVDLIPVAALPPGVRPLLDHRDSMTATLAGRWKGDISARVLTSDVTAALLRRFTAQVCASEPFPVSLAALSVDLPAVGPDITRCLMETTVPFGRLLLDSGISFTSQPQCFFTMAADPMLATLGGVTEGSRLFGRIVRLVGPDGEKLGEAVEVLPRF